MNILKISENPSIRIPEIAQALFNNYAIQTKDAIYRLTEIEFYWHSSTHKDGSVYGRHHIDPKAGEWFFHYSGVDIALRNAGGHGGILIRGLYNINTKERITGPQVCAMRLFSGYDAFNGAITTRIIERAFSPAETQCHIRKGLGKNAKDTGADQFKYRFVLQLPKGSNAGSRS